MKLAEAYVTVETNQAKFGKELKTMESSVKTSTDRMKKNFDRIGTGVSQISSAARIGFLGITAAIAGSVYAFTKMGDEIHKMSIRTGVAATELSALGYAAQISGAELNTVEKSLRYLSARMMDAKTGLAEAVRAFEELDIAIVDTEGNLRPTVDVLKDASDRIAVMTNETEKSALAAEIFGMRFGPMLLPLLNEGSEGIEKLMNKAKELGITIDTEAAAAAAEFNDRLTDMKGVLMALGREVGEVFLPVFRNTTVIIIDKVKEWRKAIDALTPQQKKLIAQIVLLGTAALGAIGALGLFAKLAVVVKAAGLIIAGTFGLITSPLGLIILAVGALAIAWAYNWGDIQGKTKAAWDFLRPIFQGIWDWLSDIGKESEELTETVKKETEKQGSAWDTFLKIFKVIGLTFVEIFKEIGAIGKEILKALGFDWDKFVDNWKAGIDVIKHWWDTKILPLFETAKEWLKLKFEWTLEKVGEGWKWFTETLMPWLWTWAETTFYWGLELAGTVWDKLKDIMQWVKEHAVFYFNWALIKIGETWDWLTDKLWPWIKEWGTKAFEWGLKLVGDIWNWLKDTLIPWVKEWKEKTFEWTLNLLGDAWEKIKELVEWLGRIPEKLKPVKEKMQEVAEASEKIVSPKAVEDLEHLEEVIRGQRVALEYAIKGWGTYNQVAKRQIAATAASFILFEHEITDIAAKAPYKFSEEFQKGFMRAKPKIQKAILDALTAGDFQRAVALAGTDAGDYFLYGRSPGGIIGELEEGQKDLSKQLDKMLGSMDAMTKKMMVIFQPIVGLFKTIFKAMLEIVKKFNPEAAAEIEAFVDDVIGMMEGLFDVVEGEADDLPDKMKPGLDKTKSLWQKFCEKVGDLWKLICKAVKAAFSDAMVAVIAGTQTIAEAFQALQKAVAVELAKMAVAAIAAGNVITGVLAGVTAVFTAFGIRIRETTTHFETAWGTIGRNFAHTTMEMGENIRGFTDMLETEFNRVGLAISKTIEDAQYKLEGLYQSQIDLQASTREKLIAELDNYYDYRILREMSLDELLALSAETRTKIEQGAIKEVSESEAEQEARRKDQAVSRLQRIEDQYRREDELIRRKIALTEIEIKFLELKIEREEHGHSARARQLEQELDQMLDAYKESVEAYEDAERRKQAATDETRETVEEANEEMRDSTEVAAEAMEDAMRGTAEAIEDAAEDMSDAIEEATRGMVSAINTMTDEIVQAIRDMAQDIINAINDMVDKINAKLKEIPEEIKFDIFGILHMPSIPSIGTQYFSIIGKYKAPSIPSAQVGIPYIPRTMPVIVHREEAILNPLQAREWRGGSGESRVVERRTVEQNITIQSLFPPDDPVLWDRIWREGLRAAAERESGRRVA